MGIRRGSVGWRNSSLIVIQDSGCVTLNSTEAEYVSPADCTEDLLFSGQLAEFPRPQLPKIRVTLRQGGGNQFGVEPGLHQ